MNEDAQTEFKRELTKDCMKTVVAFSNTAGGIMYIGIDDNGTPVGVKDTDSVSLKTVQLLSDTIRPDVKMTTSVDNIEMDGKNIVKIDVREGPSKPYYLREKGMRPEGVYVRMGPSSIQASDAQILRMVKETGSPFESLISFQQDLTFNETEKIFAEVGVEFGHNQMVSLGFFEGDLYTNLAFLFSDQCTAGMKLAAYSDRNKTGFLDRTEIRGSILTHAQKAMEFLKSYNPLRSQFVGLRRTDFRAYPENALREALVNATIHRDYSMNADTLVSVFGDGLSVTSYGGLLKGLGVDDLLLGMSSPRNPKIASIFYRLGFIESYGTGIPRMMGEYRNALEKPSLEFSTNVFKVNLPAIVPAVQEQLPIDAIVKLASMQNAFSRTDAEQATGFSKTKTYELLSAMVEEGLLEKIGEGRSIKYILAKK